MNEQKRDIESLKRNKRTRAWTPDSMYRGKRIREKKKKLYMNDYNYILYEKKQKISSAK